MNTLGQRPAVFGALAGLGVEEDKWLPGWELVDTEALDDWLSG